MPGTSSYQTSMAGCAAARMCERRDSAVGAPDSGRKARSPEIKASSARTGDLLLAVNAIQYDLVMSLKGDCSESRRYCFRPHDADSIRPWHTLRPGKGQGEKG